TTLRNAFMGLVSNVGTPYAYVLDEEIVDTMPTPWAQLPAVHTAVAAGRPPADPFWLNYFSAAYAEAIGLDLLAEVGGGGRAAARGYVLPLTRDPWELTHSRLREVRQRWAQVLRRPGSAPP